MARAAIGPGESPPHHNFRIEWAGLFYGPPPRLIMRYQCKLALTARRIGIPRCPLAELATRGSAISFLTRERASLQGADRDRCDITFVDRRCDGTRVGPAHTPHRTPLAPAVPSCDSTRHLPRTDTRSRAVRSPAPQAAPGPTATSPARRPVKPFESEWETGTLYWKLIVATCIA
jgi:hypothetical protein